MMNYKKLLISSGCLILAFSLAAQEQPDTLRLSLPDAQTYSLQYNRTVKSSQLDIEIAKKKVQETTSIGLPQFSVTANYQHIFKIPELSFPVTGFTQDPLITSEPVSGLQQFDGPGGLE